MEEENYWTRVLKQRIPRRQAIRAGALFGLALAGAGVTATRCSSRESAYRAASTPKRGGTLRYNLGADLAHYDVHTADNYLTAGPAQYVYSGLLKLEERRADDLAAEYAFHTDLAESYELPQPDIVTFKLRKGVTFHDKPPVNGRELTSEDVKYSIDRIRAPESQFLRRSMLEELDKVDTPDKHTVQFTLTRPSVPFIYSIASPWTLIAPKEVVDRDGDLKKTMIGTGPFMLDKHTRNSSLRFTRNPRYFQSDRPYLDAIEAKIFPDADKALAALISREIDFGSATYAESEDLKKRIANAEVIQAPGTGKMVCILRLDRPPLNDVRVRQALMYALDYRQFIETISQGRGRRDGPVQWWLKPYALSEDELPGTDLEKAVQLLAEAGFPDGFPIQATVSANLYGAQLAEIAQAQWKAIGVDLEIKTLEWGIWLKTAWEKQDFHLYFLQEWNYEDPDRWLFPHFHSKGVQNYSAYAEPRVDALLEKQRETFGLQERAAIIKDIQRALLDDVAYIPLYTPTQHFVRYPYVRDWMPTASWPAQHAFGALRAWLNK